MTAPNPSKSVAWRRVVHIQSQNPCLSNSRMVLLTR